MRKSSFGLLVVLIGALLGVLPTHAQSNQATFEPADCPFPTIGIEGDFECGYLIVPENRTDPNSADIRLAVAIFYSLSPNPAPDPYIYLEGGPGGSPLASVNFYADSPFRAERDVITFDQRGTGYSEPTLNCPELDDADDTVQADEACYNRLVNQGIDLSGYNSVESAADVDALWRALGYNEVNIYGVSYGTRLAMTIMRYYPDGLRSVVLDGIYPPETNPTEDDPINFYGALSAMFADCAADSACNAAFPDLEARFYDMLPTIFDEPATAYDPDSEEDIDLYAADIIQLLYQQLYVTSIIPSLPLAIDAATNGDFDTFYEVANYGIETDEGGDLNPEDMTMDDATAEAEFLLEDLTEDEYSDIEGLALDGDAAGIADYLADLFDGEQAYFDMVAQGIILLLDTDVIPNDGDSEGMYNAVTCNEEIPFDSMDNAYDFADAAGVPVDITDNIVTADLFDTCALWQTGTADPVENTPVVSDIPTLILSGEYDPATPPRWGERAAQSLRNSFTFVFPSTGHGQIDAGDCPVSIAMAFIDNPTVEPDSSCIASMLVQFITD